MKATKFYSILTIWLKRSFLKSFFLELPMLRLSLIALISSLSLYGASWINDLDTALARGKKEEKPILAYFTGPWCIWCQRLDEVFLSQSSFDKLSQDMIFVKLEYSQNSKDLTQNQVKWKRTYQVYSYPTLLVLNSQGVLVGSVGYPRDSLEEFIARIRSLAGISENANRASTSQTQAEQNGKATTSTENSIHAKLERGRSLSSKSSNQFVKDAPSPATPPVTPLATSPIKSSSQAPRFIPSDNNSRDDPSQ